VKTTDNLQMNNSGLILFSFVILFGSISAALIGNAITHNALTSNALSGNAITLNALTSNALSINQLTLNALTGSAIGPNENSLTVLETNSLEKLAILMKEVPWNVTLSLVPELMQFFVGCALDSGQIWNMTYNNTGYSYDGSLGIAPSDLSTPLTLVQAQWISACLMARVNYFEHHVLISIRGTIFSTTPEEEEQYDVYEGSFFGNIFTLPQQKYVCEGPNYGQPGQSPDQVWRVCTEKNSTSSSGVNGCDFTVVGYCNDVCQSADGPCTVNGTRFDDVIAVYLRNDGAMLRGMFIIIVCVVVALSF